MEKQKEQLQKLLERLGYEQEVAADIADGFMNADEDSEPELPIDGILLKAQEYARPILRSSLKREFSHEFKGQYMGEAINKIVAASKGKIRRANYEDGNLERALQDLVSAVVAGAGNNEEAEVMITELKRQLEITSKDREQEVLQLRKEFAEKENARLVYDALFARLGNLQQGTAGKAGKRLSVDQAHAAKTLVRELGEEYALHYDEQAKDIKLRGREGKEGETQINLNEVIEKVLVRNSWIAQSNGGSVNASQFLNRPQHNPAKNTGEGSEFRKQLEAQVGKAV